MICLFSFFFFSDASKKRLGAVDAEEANEAVQARVAWPAIHSRLPFWADHLRDSPSVQRLFQMVFWLFFSVAS